MRDLLLFIKNKKIGKVNENFSMSLMTTFKVGGKAKIIVYPKDVKKLIMLLKELKEKNIKYKVLGNGSNVIFSDDVYDGVIIKLDELNDVSVKDTIVKAGAGVNLAKLSYLALKEGLTGLEFAQGIPGSVGGAVYMNAGAYKTDMGYIVSQIEVVTPNLEIKTLYNKDLMYKYRSSFLQHKDYICVNATIVLKRGDKDAIKDLMESRKQKRILSQPLEYPSAGSVFRNPENDFAGRLIEGCNLKGYKIGGAKVSEKHANFIINEDHASAKDVFDLIHFVHDRVKEKNNVDLKIEQEFVNWEH